MGDAVSPFISVALLLFCPFVFIRLVGPWGDGGVGSMRGAMKGVVSGRGMIFVNSISTRNFPGVGTVLRPHGQRKVDIVCLAAGASSLHISRFLERSHSYLCFYSTHFFGKVVLGKEIRILASRMDGRVV